MSDETRPVPRTGTKEDETGGGEPERRPTVLVTGVSGDVGLGIIAGLARSPQPPRVVGLDRTADCAAYHLVADHVQAPPVADPGYVDFVVATARERRACLLFAGIDSEIPLLSESRSRIERETDLRLVVERPELTRVFCDKLATAEWLRQHGLPALPTLALPVSRQEILDTVGLPLVLKPRRGHGSHGIRRCFTEEELDRALGERGADEVVAQRLVDGDELTIGLLFDRDRRLADHLVFRRTLEQGRTWMATVVDDASLVELANRVGERMRGEFALNLQLRVDRHGTPFVFEINPRLSGSTALRVAVGCNDPARLYMHLVHGEAIEPAVVAPATCHRLFSQVVVPEAAPGTRRGPEARRELAAVETLVFDCADTLLALDPSREQTCRAALAAIGVSRSLPAIAEAYARLDFALPRQSSRETEPPDREAWYREHNSELALLLGLESRAGELHEALLAAFTSGTQWRAVPGAQAALAELGRRFPLHVLANWDRSLESQLERNDLLRFFDSVHASAELGCEKPAAAAFETFAERSGVELGRAAYVGNDYRADVAAARGVGMTPILIDHFGRGPFECDCLRVEGFPALLSLFG